MTIFSPYETFPEELQLHITNARFCVRFMSFGQSVEIGIGCQIFVIVSFFNCGRVLQFGAHLRYYRGALTQKRSFLGLCTTFRSEFHVG